MLHKSFPFTTIIIKLHTYICNESWMHHIDFGVKVAIQWLLKMVDIA